MPEDLPAMLQPGFEGEVTAEKRTGQTLYEILSDVERSVILRALKKHNFNRTKTAQELGINRRTLYEKIKEHGLETCLPEE